MMMTTQASVHLSSPVLLVKSNYVTEQSQAFIYDPCNEDIRKIQNVLHISDYDLFLSHLE